MLYKINATDNASEQLDDFSHYYKSVSKETYRKFSLDIRLILFMLKTNPEIYRVRYKKVTISN